MLLRFPLQSFCMLRTARIISRIVFYVVMRMLVHSMLRKHVLGNARCLESDGWCDLTPNIYSTMRYSGTPAVWYFGGWCCVQKIDLETTFQVVVEKKTPCLPLSAARLGKRMKCLLDANTILALKSSLPIVYFLS